jgi:2-haloacid dehalogenase
VDVVFDAMGTLFDPAPLRERLGAPVFEAWFERTIHSAATLTILGEFVPFAQLARSTLATTTAVLGLDVDVDAEATVGELRRLPPAPDARRALERVLEQGGRSFVLTNGGREAGEELAERAGFGELVERVFGVDEVRAYKPDPRPYRLVLDALDGPAVLVATHAWDVSGAVRAGMRGVWVDRTEQSWPLPDGLVPCATAPGLVEAVELATRP